MVKKIGDKGKVKGVDSAKETEDVKKTESVGGVGKIQKTGAISGAGAVARTGRSSVDGTITKANKEQLFQMVEEELDKLIASGAIPAKQRDVVKSAIEMTIEGALVDEE